jgi:hypothetical protein
MWQCKWLQVLYISDVNMQDFSSRIKDFSTLWVRVEFLSCIPSPNVVVS